MVETAENQRGTCCTLSYRWSSNPVELKLNNIDAFKVALPLMTLPVQIQHAIQVIQWLGFRYLWVDALCIAQDCHADWETEAVKMAATYSNSSLTIAAVDPPDKLRPDSDDLFTVQGPSTFTSGYRPPGELDSRGWVTQEELLSLRVLSFTEAGIFWSCCRWNCSEKCPDGVQELRDASASDSPSWKWAMILQNVGKLTRSSPGTWRGEYRVWYEVLRDYSRRNFSRESDRFTALHGLISAFSCSLSDQNFAGVWKGNVLTDLA